MQKQIMFAAHLDGEDSIRYHAGQHPELPLRLRLILRVASKQLVQRGLQRTIATRMFAMFDAANMTMQYLR